MIAYRFIRQWIWVLCLCLFAASALAQAQGSAGYQPKERQEGKDVIWLPTAQKLVDKMLDMAKVTAQDYVIDLGSGDGRLVITAAKRGARALGVEYNPDLVEFSKRNASKEGVTDKAQFIQADLFETDLSRATVITMFLLPDINLRLRPKILNLKPGTRIVSNTFDMEEWQPDEASGVEEGQNCTTYCSSYLWIVPAKVEGAWRLQQGELTLRQNFQMVFGTLRSTAASIPITDGRLKGDQISFTAAGTLYTGRVKGDAMEGSFKSGNETGNWSATRIGDVIQAQSP